MLSKNFQFSDENKLPKYYFTDTENNAVLCKGRATVVPDVKDYIAKAHE